MDPIVIPMLFVGAVALAAVVFVIWVVLKLLLLALYIVLLPVRWLFGGHRFRPATPPQSRLGLRCAFSNCQALNPPNARFCGRCGSPLHGTPATEQYHYPPGSRMRVTYAA